MSESPTPHPEVARVRDAICDHLAEIAALFRPGVKLTLLARSPSHGDGTRDLVMSDDDITAAIAALTIRRDADATR